VTKTKQLNDWWRASSAKWICPLRAMARELAVGTRECSRRGSNQRMGHGRLSQPA
jgi:hypothetical protein